MTSRTRSKVIKLEYHELLTLFNLWSIGKTKVQASEYTKLSLEVVEWYYVVFELVAVKGI
jgi:hypothetical protein